MYPRRKNNTLKTIGITLAVIVVSVGLLVAWALWERKPTEMLERVDSLAIPSGWTLTDEKVTGKINFCLEKAGCPSMYRKYRLDRKYSIEELKEVMKPLSGMPEIYNESCESSPLFTSSSVPLCGLEIAAGKYLYDLSQSTNDHRTSFWASIEVRQS